MEPSTPIETLPVVQPGPDIPCLVSLAKAGDAEAFGTLVEHHYDRLFRQALHLSRSEQVADELVEETFVQAWKSIRRFNETCLFTTWLAAILFNQFRSWRRKQLQLSIFSEWLGQEPPEVSASPFAGLTELERQQALWQCVNRLPKKQAQVVYLRFMEAGSISSIACLLKVSEGTVKSRLFTALKRLREMPEMKNLEVL